MSYKHRTIEPVIQKASKSFRVVMVSGMRQVGKSTLLLHLGADRTNVTLDDVRPLEIANTMRNVFFKQYSTPILIDEIQRSPDLCLEIKSIVDRDPTPGLVWLTGSQRFAVMKNVSESLAGRMADFELLPFSLYERQNKAFEQKIYVPPSELKRGTLNPLEVSEIWKCIWQGSWPQLIDMDEQERHWFYNGILQTYIERDVRQTSGVEKLDEFQRFLRILASRTGQEFMVGKIAAEAGVAVQTAKEWLSVAESSGVIFLLPPFYENIGKTLIKKPKIYFTDTGLASWLCDFTTPEELRASYISGSFFENFVISELRKSWIHNGKRPSFYFYRDTRFNEIDLLIKVSNTYHPVEIKCTANPQSSMVKAFDCIKGPNIKRGNGALICFAKEMAYLREDVIAHGIMDI